MKSFILPRSIAIAWILVATACQSATGIVATYRKSGGTTMTVEIDGRGYGRIEERRNGANPNLEDYSLVMPGGRTISVVNRNALLGRRAGGGTVVMDSLDFTAWLRRSGHQSSPSVNEQGPFREAGEARVGQWTGTRYVLAVRPGTFADIRELVVLRSPDLAPLGRLLAENSLNAWRGYGMVRIPGHVRDMARLMAEGAPLSVGENFTLIALERKRVDPARLRPPSRPLSRAELFRLLSPRPTSNNPPQVVELPR